MYKRQRVNPQLVIDYYSAPIILANGQGSNTQYVPYNWGFSSLSINNKNEAISTNLGQVKFDFCNPIDTLKNATKKTVLLKSSNYTALKGVPTELDLATITQEPIKEHFTKGQQNLAVLLENDFKSTYKDRILPHEIKEFKSNSSNSKFCLLYTSPSPRDA